MYTNKKVEYLIGDNVWVVYERTPVIIWKDGPIKKRICYDSFTKETSRYYRKDVISSTKECLIVKKFDGNGNLWFMKVEKGLI